VRSSVLQRFTVFIHWLGTPLVGHAALVAVVGWALAGFGELGAVAVLERDGAWLPLATAATIALCALVSSIAGFAFSALAGGALAYLGADPVHAVETMVLCSIAIQLYAVWNIRESIRCAALWPMVAAGAMTVPAGVWLLLHVDAMIYALGLGVFLVTYGCYVLLRGEARVVRVGTWGDAAVGALGGLAGGLAGFPGSFVTIWCSLRGWDKLAQRAVYQPYILLMQLVTIACLHVEAPRAAHSGHDLAFVPFALLGAMAGLALFRRMTNKQFHAAVSALLVASGVGLVARAL
jgi:uncharacterized membrane protein YfcA